MILHKVRSGDTVFQIAREYGISPMKIIENNGLQAPDRLTVGQELLILAPTRTYTVRGGDTLSGIARRFEVKRSQLLANNPHLAGEERIYPSQLLAIKYETQKYGMGALNGYIYRGVKREAVRRCLPYLTYATVGAYAASGEELLPLFDDTALVTELRAAGKVVLLRIAFREHSELFGCETRWGAFFKACCELAKSRGYHGITLAPYALARENSDGYLKFILAARRELLGSDLILFTELDGNGAYILEDAADASVLTYEKCLSEKIETFESGERQLLSRYGELGEGSRIFLELPTVGYDNGEPIEYDEILKIAYKNRAEIKHDEETKIASFEYCRYRSGRREKRCVLFESLESIRARLALAWEFGLMGVSVDLGKCPTHTLMMFHALFHPVDYTFV